MFENNGYGQALPQGSGYQFNGYGTRPVQPKRDNYLTKEEIQRLMTRENVFNLQISETDSLRAKCNHQRPDGLGDALVEDPVTGEVECSICHYKFKPIDANTAPEDIKDSVRNIVDILQTTKMLYIDLPQEAAAEYYQIIPLIEKIPAFFDIAVKNYAQHEGVNGFNYNSRNMSTMNLFNMLSGWMANGSMPQQSQFYGQQPQAPQGYYGQPVATPGMTPAYANPASNGFGVYGGQPQGYAPQNAGWNYGTPQARSPTPVASAPDTTVEGTAVPPTV